MSADHLVFRGHIAGFGTRLGARIVIGCWTESPFGRFTDAMVQTADDERILLAPCDDVADFVSSTYHFERVMVGPVDARLTGETLTLSASELDVVVSIGGPTGIDRLLRLIPVRLAAARWWLSTIDPIVARILPGVRTAGTAGRGRREYYGVHRSRRITSVTGWLHGADLGGLAPLQPPVRFGFGSAPAMPQIVAVTTRIDLGPE